MVADCQLVRGITDVVSSVGTILKEFRPHVRGGVVNNLTHPPYNEVLGAIGLCRYSVVAWGVVCVSALTGADPDPVWCVTCWGCHRGIGITLCSGSDLMSPIVP